ncbi:uncharacterized protein BX663DRAFT_321088 [Cokeromyces recurvatus]|uniref:uncharacterized protein n=1 Tax=Cokeromyces recurvatus TaxID=90255 RepID=UPI00221FDA13|nr:uncharacterized protein BX663DRAFT_321088 [Cokeromyces recurvatus]KAI7904562.1 hypothetical protein BX663DRAFT_321088 [Cokeromyces recurvatus]
MFKEEENSLLSDVFLNLQTHIKEQMLHLNMEQKVLLKRIAYVDELSLTNFQIMVASLQQVRLVADKIPEGNNNFDVLFCRTNCLSLL